MSLKLLLLSLKPKWSCQIIPKSVHRKQCKYKYMYKCGWYMPQTVNTRANHTFMVTSNMVVSSSALILFYTFSLYMFYIYCLMIVHALTYLILNTISYKKNTFLKSHFTIFWCTITIKSESGLGWNDYIGRHQQIKLAKVRKLSEPSRPP